MGTRSSDPFVFKYLFRQDFSFEHGPSFGKEKVRIMPPGNDEAQMQRLEKESERFTIDIKHTEKENERLREQIASLKCQIQQSNKALEEVTQVSDILGIAIYGGVSLRPMRMLHSE